MDRRPPSPLSKLSESELQALLVEVVERVMQLRPPERRDSSGPRRPRPPWWLERGHVIEGGRRSTPRRGRLRVVPGRAS